MESREGALVTGEIVILSPELNAGGGGLADHALHVVEEWGDHARVRFIVPESGKVSPTSAYPVARIEKRGSALRKKLPSDGGKVLLHYSAYGFDRVGYPRWLLRALADWKRESKGLLVVMFHEIWTFWPLLNRNYLVQRLHRADIRKLVSVADAVFTSTPSQAEHLLDLVPTSAVQVLPVGSNIRLQSSADEPRKTGVAVLFGLQIARIKALRKMQVELRSIAAAQLIKKGIAVGQGNTADDEEHALWSELRLAEGFEQRGASSEAEVSRLLSTASFGLSAQDELSLHKSGTFMAYAAHGLNILSPYADSFAPEPICWLTQSAELLRGISADELKSRAENLRSWQERTSSWSEIARRFADALQLEMPIARALR